MASMRNLEIMEIQFRRSWMGTSFHDVRVGSSAVDRWHILCVCFYNGSTRRAIHDSVMSRAVSRSVSTIASTPVAIQSRSAEAPIPFLRPALLH